MVPLACYLRHVLILQYPLWLELDNTALNFQIAFFIELELSFRYDILFTLFLVQIQGGI